MLRHTSTATSALARVRFNQNDFEYENHSGMKKKKKKLSACRGEGSVVGLQLRVRFVPAALLAMLRTALALQCVSKARD
jgi:hypothetical protein